MPRRRAWIPKISGARQRATACSSAPARNIPPRAKAGVAVVLVIGWGRFRVASTVDPDIMALALTVSVLIR